MQNSASQMIENSQNSQDRDFNVLVSDKSINKTEGEDTQTLNSQNFQ